MGNTLLCFALWAILELALCDGFGILEHPAEPEDAPEKASIWRLPLVRTLLAMDHVQKIRFAQGLMGSFAPKPTHLLVVNMPELILDLHRNRVRRELPKAHAIGKDQSGHGRPRFSRSTLRHFAKAWLKLSSVPLTLASRPRRMGCLKPSCSSVKPWTARILAIMWVLTLQTDEPAALEFAQHDGRSRTLQCAGRKNIYIYVL